MWRQFASCQTTVAANEDDARQLSRHSHHCISHPRSATQLCHSSSKVCGCNGNSNKPEVCLSKLLPQVSLGLSKSPHQSLKKGSLKKSSLTTVATGVPGWASILTGWARTSEAPAPPGFLCCYELGIWRGRVLTDTFLSKCH